MFTTRCGFLAFVCFCRGRRTAGNPPKFFLRTAKAAFGIFAGERNDCAAGKGAKQPSKDAAPIVQPSCTGKGLILPARIARWRYMNMLAGVPHIVAAKGRATRRRMHVFCLPRYCCWAVWLSNGRIRLFSERNGWPCAGFWPAGCRWRCR